MVNKHEDGGTLLYLFYYLLKDTQKQLSSLEELLQTMSMVGNGCKRMTFRDWQIQLSSNLVKSLLAM